MPLNLRQDKPGANFSISFSQLKTTEVGQITRFGAFLFFSFAFCINASACSVLPSPMSSARIPFKPYWYINHSQPKPLVWYSLNSALMPLGRLGTSIVEKVEICFQNLLNLLLILSFSPRFSISEIRPARYVFTMYLLSSFL